MSQMTFQAFTTDSPLYLQAQKIRNDVLRLPLGLDLFDEDLTCEREFQHFGVIEENELTAYAMVLPAIEGYVTLRQMCVNPGKQIAGRGKFLMQQVEQSLQQQSVTSIRLAARVTARGFYEKLGYRITGEEFISVGIPHVWMTKTIRV